MSKTRALDRHEGMLQLVRFPGETRGAHRLHQLRSVTAVFAGFSTIFLVSSLLDRAVDAAGFADSHYVFAFFSHSAIGALGCTLTARLAPPGRAERVVGLCALAFSLSIVAAVGPSWYPLTVLVSVIPAALLGSNVDSLSPR